MQQIMYTLTCLMMCIQPLVMSSKSINILPFTYFTNFFGTKAQSSIKCYPAPLVLLAPQNVGEISKLFMTLDVKVAIVPLERGLKGIFKDKSNGPPGFTCFDVFWT